MRTSNYNTVPCIDWVRDMIERNSKAGIETTMEDINFTKKFSASAVYTAINKLIANGEIRRVSKKCFIKKSPN